MGNLVRIGDIVINKTKIISAQIDTFEYPVSITYTEKKKIYDDYVMKQLKYLTIVLADEGETREYELYNNNNKEFEIALSEIKSTYYNILIDANNCGSDKYSAFGIL